MFSTRPSRSRVWKVQATSAGMRARKLVSGLPSGSSGCLSPSNLRTGTSPRTRSLSPAWLENRPTTGSDGGSIARMRTAWMSLLL
jgi:hypothetical protein